uniref:Uncharacterized protein n=1 Tax=Eikenella corrodens TaxID=539 RepID=A0A1A9RBL3_EIKCO|nr:hypothetical protein A7P90_11165 [Eikenella corrodens]
MGYLWLIMKTARLHQKVCINMVSKTAFGKIIMIMAVWRLKAITKMVSSWMAGNTGIMCPRHRFAIGSISFQVASNEERLPEN